VPAYELVLDVREADFDPASADPELTLRVPRDRERSDRRIVNAKIGAS
jgi:hypothetical protein